MRCSSRARLLLRHKKVRLARPPCKSPVIILDFSETGGEITQLGVALADEFSQALTLHAAGFEVLDRPEFRKNLSIQRIKPSTLQDKAAAQCSAHTAGADLFVTGILTPQGDSALLHLRLVRVGDGKEIGEVSQSIPLSTEMRDLAGKPVVGLPLIPSADSLLPRPGRNGIGYPSCVFCPTPQYTEAGRKAKLSGSVILRITITPEGRTENIQTIIGIPCGLTDQAIVAVREWKFKPVTGLDGKPVAVRTDIEITFRLL